MSALNTGVFLISRQGEGGVNTVAGVTYEGVYVFKDSWADRSNHASYFFGTEVASDGLVSACSLTCISPSGKLGGFKSAPGVTGNRRQFASLEPNEIFGVSLRIYVRNVAHAYNEGLDVF